MVRGEITAEISIYVRATMCENFAIACHVLRRLHLLALLATGEHYGQECPIRMSQSQSLKLCVPIDSIQPEVLECVSAIGSSAAICQRHCIN